MSLKIFLTILIALYCIFFPMDTTFLTDSPVSIEDLAAYSIAMFFFVIVVSLPVMLFYNFYEKFQNRKQ